MASEDELELLVSLEALLSDFVCESLEELDSPPDFELESELESELEPSPDCFLLLSRKSVTYQPVPFK